MNDDRRQALEAQLSAYLDDELDPQERRDLEAVLADDEELRALLEQLRATVEAVRLLPRARASEQLVESLRARMERRSLLDGPSTPVHLGPTGRPYLRWMAAAAVIALTTTAGYLMWPLAQERFGHPNRTLVLLPDKTKDAADTTLSRGDRKAAPGQDTPGSLTLTPSDASADHFTELSKAHIYTPTKADGEISPEDKPELVMRNGELAYGDKAGVERLAGRPGSPTTTAPSTPGTGYDADLGSAVVLGDGGDAFTINGQNAGALLGLDLAPSGASEPTTAPQHAPPIAATVVQLTFADERSRDDAVRLLRDNYAFQPATPALQGAAPPAEAATNLYMLRVGDEESARRVVEGVERSVASAQNVGVLEQAVDQAGLAKLNSGLAPSLSGDFGKEKESAFGQDEGPGAQARAPSAAAPPTPAAQAPEATPAPAAESAGGQPTNAYGVPSEPAGNLLQEHREAAKSSEAPEPASPAAKPRAAKSPSTQPSDNLDKGVRGTGGMGGGSTERRMRPGKPGRSGGAGGFGAASGPTSAPATGTAPRVRPNHPAPSPSTAHAKPSPTSGPAESEEQNRGGSAGRWADSAPAGKSAKSAPAGPSAESAPADFLGESVEPNGDDYSAPAGGRVTRGATAKGERSAGGKRPATQESQPEGETPTTRESGGTPTPQIVLVYVRVEAPTTRPAAAAAAPASPATQPASQK